MYAKNALLFPYNAIPFLRKLRGVEWQELVERVLTFPEAHEEVLAFSLMMIRLNGCLACETDSFRAMKGCDACSIQTLRRYKGTDRELLVLYRQALDDVRSYLSGKSGDVEVA
jgi:hypothetical protein